MNRLIKSRRIALVATLPALIGAAPLQQSQLSAALECRLPRVEALAEIGRLPVERVGDHSVPPNRNVITFYTPPSDLMMYGFPLSFLALTDRLQPDDQRQLLMMSITAPYADVERAVLAANHATACGERREAEEGMICGVYAHQVDGWRVAVIVQQHYEQVAVACSYSRRPV